FSRRRRHTRFSRDWSSDVCSSALVRCGAQDDLPLPQPFPHESEIQQLQVAKAAVDEPGGTGDGTVAEILFLNERDRKAPQGGVRSDERRVGKERGGVLWSCHGGHK